MKSVEFRHVIRPEKGQPFTFAYMKDDKGNYVVGVCVCSKKDQYSRPMGRKVAIRRMLDKQRKLENVDVMVAEGKSVIVNMPTLHRNHKRDRWGETVNVIKQEIQETISKREQAKVSN